MKNYIGRKVNTAIFISGTGSNMKNLIKFSKTNKSPIKVKLVISSNKNAKGIIYASKKKIDNYSFKFSDLENTEKNIFKVLDEKKIKLICLAGFMKILSYNFIKKFKGKIINIHPSLLPKYKGLNTYNRALENGEKYTGCTVHFVNSKLDGGKMILQKKIKILKKDNEITLAKKVLKLEHKIYPRSIIKVCD